MLAESMTPLKLQVSVIIPTKGDRPQMLSRALDSIINQTKLPSEVIVVVDSNREKYDEIIKIVHKHQIFERIKARVIQNGTSRSQGVSYARNLGVKYAKNIFLSFLDDDDAWKTSYLEKVFMDGVDFDVALVGFEKHKNGNVIPEKKPPKSLKIRSFLVANPGLRGSNITIKKKIYEDIQGFSLDLPAFNDLDFGIKLSSIVNLKYKRIDEYLVEFYSHSKERLSTPGCEANIIGMERFLLKHGNKMTYIEEAKFRKRGQKLWAIDSWTIKKLIRRWVFSKKNDLINQDFPNILHALETLLYEEVINPCYGITKIQKIIETICEDYENANLRKTPPSLNFALILTNPSISLKELARSLSQELDRSFWALNHLKKNPIKIYIYINSQFKEQVDKLYKVIKKSRDKRIEFIVLNNEDEPYEIQTIGECRKDLMQKLREHRIIPSKDNPIWFLDEDMRFANIFPSNEKWVIRRVGSIFHRLESIINIHKFDAIVSSCTGAPPVPILTTVYRQLRDLKALLLKSKNTLNWSGSMTFIKKYKDYYYDLCRQTIPNKSFNFYPYKQFLKVSSFHNLFGRNFDFINLAAINKLIWHLLNGLPITRPVVNVLSDDLSTAWGIPEKAIVSGGNFIVLSNKVLNPGWYNQIEISNIKSRRSDTCWCINSQFYGCKVQKLNLNLLHNRYPLFKYGSNGQFHQDTIIDNLNEDILGVALYETLLSSGPLSENKTWKNNLIKNFDKRIEINKHHLKKVENILSDIKSLLIKQYGLITIKKDIPYWDMLTNIVKYRDRFCFNQNINEIVIRN